MADKTMDSSLLKVLEESRQSSNKAKWFYELMNAYYQDCIMHIGPTAEIVERIRPVYNFKAAE